MKPNLNSLGDGIIVLGLGVFLSSIGGFFISTFSQSTSLGNTLVLVSFLVLGLAIVVAGILKIANAFTSAHDERGSNLKTAVAAAIIGFVMLYYSFIAFTFRYLI